MKEKEFSENLYYMLMKGNEIPLKDAIKAFYYFDENYKRFNSPLKEELPQANVDGQLSHFATAVKEVGTYIVSNTDDSELADYIDEVGKQLEKINLEIDKLIR